VVPPPLIEDYRGAGIGCDIRLDIVLFQSAEEGGFVITRLALPGLVTEEDTLGSAADGGAFDPRVCAKTVSRCT
jgi:hypothetical protein